MDPIKMDRRVATLPTHTWMLLLVATYVLSSMYSRILHDWLTADLNEMLPAADLNIINSETE